jgi:hypothetical protein
MSPATLAPRTFAQSPSQDYVDLRFPTWHSGVCVLRDESGVICGSLWVTRQENGGVELVLVTNEPPVESASMEDTKF